MKIENIYQKYNLQANLRYHQYQVAAVTKIIVESIMSVDEKLRNSLIKVALTHDMANILKFDLEKYPETTEPEGLEYWRNIKNEYKKKYGDDEHNATVSIAKEIGLNEFEIDLLNTVGFSQGPTNLAKGDITYMIVGYADARVNFGSIVSIDERFEKTLARKKANYASQGKALDESIYNEQHNSFRKIEELIFKSSEILSKDIDDNKVSSYIDSLKSFEI
ncbi:MAG: hypothetical protein Q9M91_01815 [Candidatus Dojkabacteria bacterium]|nr:hypothetical protein [Candidatus Dojkabacteria bacterium]MDQ7020561.1 hypothetical protein [Candidatus Dojkabacteria bacterium]